MRIIFMGTPDFAVPCLKALLENKDKYEVVCVVTKPDMPKGRKMQLTPPPVKEVAVEAGIPVIQPQTVKTKEFYEIKEITPCDMFPNTYHVESICVLSR